MNSMEPSEIVEEVIARGNASSLYDLLAGEMEASRYLINPERLEDKILLAGAVCHLEYLVQFPGTSAVVLHDGKVFAPYPEEFQRWLAAGTPGLRPEDMARAGLLSPEG